MSLKLEFLKTLFYRLWYLKNSKSSTLTLKRLVCLYNKALTHIYLSATAAQTAGPTGLTNFKGTHEYPGVNIG